MAPRDTRTGAVLESIVLPALKQGGYSFEQGALVGLGPSRDAPEAEVVASDKLGSHLLSMKWQQVSRTANLKVPFELICSIELLKRQPQKYQTSFVSFPADSDGVSGTFYVGDGSSA